MALVTYVEHDGTEHNVDVPAGDSVMLGALNHSIASIVGECGGGGACATCRCSVTEPWREKVGLASELEQQMLEFANDELKPGDRLSCQITISDALEGLVVHLPQSQY